MSEDTELSGQAAETKARFIRDVGTWNELWDELAELDPDFLASLLDVYSHPWRKGSLDPKVREFVYIAIDASTTHLWEHGLRRHIRNALRQGATKEEVLEVLQLVSILGIHTLNMGVPALTEEVEEVASGRLD